MMSNVIAHFLYGFLCTARATGIFTGGRVGVMLSLEILYVKRWIINLRCFLLY